MKQRLINWFMILEPIVTFILSFYLLLYCHFYLRISNTIHFFTAGYIYIRVIKYSLLIILLIALIRSIFKNKVLRFRYFIYAFVCIIQLSFFIFFQYALFSSTAYDTSIGVVSVRTDPFNGGRGYQNYSIYENYDKTFICQRTWEQVYTIPEDKIIDNDGIIEYYYYDGNKTIIYKYEFKIELTYEEKLEYVNVFVNEVYNYDEKNLLD